MMRSITFIGLLLCSFTLAQEIIINKNDNSSKQWGVRDIQDAARSMIERTRQRYTEIIEEERQIRNIEELKTQKIQTMLDLPAGSFNKQDLVEEYR